MDKDNIENFDIPEKIKKLICQGNISDVALGLELLHSRYPKYFDNLRDVKFIYHNNDRAFLETPYKVFDLGQFKICMGSIAFWKTSKKST